MARAPTRSRGQRRALRPPRDAAGDRAIGRLLSRAMAKINRTEPAWTARAHTNTAKTTSIRNTVPRPGPSTSMTIIDSPPAIWLSSRRAGSLTARIAETIKSADGCGGGQRLKDRPRGAAARLAGLLGQRARRIEAVEHVRGRQRPEQRRAEISPGPALPMAQRLEQDARAPAP